MIDKDIQENNEILLKKFTSEREQWESDYKKMILSLKDFSKVQDLVYEISSYRHLFVDKKFNLRSMIIDLKLDYDIRFASKLAKYVNSEELREKFFSYKEREKMIDAEYSIRKKRIQLVENQIEFYSEIIQSLDKLGWQIKNIIDVEKIKVGM